MLTNTLNIAAQTQLINPEIEAKVDSLLEIMTLEDKVGQLNLHTGTFDLTGPPPKGDVAGRYNLIRSGGVGAMLNVFGAENTMAAQKLAVENSRLGIPLMFGYDVIHGYKTIFPIPLGEAASWDLEVAEQSARVSAIEAASVGITWTFAPMIDITRDARWGRVMESPGESPYLISRIVEAKVRGFQTDDLSSDQSIAATAKHYVAYGFSEAGRDYNTIEISPNTLHNAAMPPFKAASDAGVATIMSSFNDVWGIPVVAHKELQIDILKKRWGFEGFIVTDWGTIDQLVPHGYTPNLKEGTRLSFNGGADMDMESLGAEKYLKELVEEGKVDISVVDESVRRILRVKFLLGLFDNPYKYIDKDKEKRFLYTDEHRSIARDAAKKSIVLLENKDGLLPLSKDVSSIAVIGKLANDKDTPLGSWRAQGEKDSAVSLLEGIKNAVPKDVNVEYAEGYKLAVGRCTMMYELEFEEDNGEGIQEAINLAQASDVVVVAVGEEAFQSGEGRSQVDISMKGKQLELLQELSKVNNNIVVVLMNGRPLAEPWMYENMTTILETWHLGTEAGNAIADVIFGNYNPSGKLPISIPRSVGQVPIYHNKKNTGRPVPDSDEVGFVYWSHYTDESNDPQYPFGYGLSYSSFEYTNLRVSSESMLMNEKVTVTVDVTNNSNFDGEEVVQFYIHDQFASTVQPIKELKGFKKIKIFAGETETVSFEVDKETLGFYDNEGIFVTEPGTFTFMVGTNSSDLLKVEFELKSDD
ncbi:MAG: beta-glucosidase BglX [Balneola sp.]